MFVLLIIALVVLLVCFLSIPPDVRVLLVENCRDRQGRISGKRVFRELASVLNFFSGVFFFGFVALIVAAFALLLVDSYLIPTKLIGNAFAQAEFNVSSWRQSLTSGNDSVQNQFQRWHVMTGGSTDSAKTMMKFLWSSIPIACVGIVFFVIVVLRSTSKSYKAALENLVQHAADHDLAQVRKNYLSENRTRLRSSQRAKP